MLELEHLLMQLICAWWSLIMADPDKSSNTVEGLAGAPTQLLELTDIYSQLTLGSRALVLGKLDALKSEFSL